MLESEEKGYNSETITRQPFRLSKKWKKKFEPNIDLMDNHLINHNLINHNLSQISGDSKEDNCPTAIKSESIETDLDIQTLEHKNNSKHKMQSYKPTLRPQCPDFEPSDCPFSCCVFLCLIAKHSRLNRKNEKKREKDDKKSLKYSSNSIQSNCNTTASTVPEDEYNKNPTRVSSQTNLNNQESTENIHENENLLGETIESSDATLKRLNKNTQV